MALLIAVVGRRGSGKTTTIVYLTRQLAKEGLKIGSIKHIHDPNFTIDTPGKDTFRFAQAGAKIIVSSAAVEIAIIKKCNGHRESFHLQEILDLIKEEKLDIIFLEGFHSIVAKRDDVYKIITANNQEDLEKTLRGTAPPILAVASLTGNQISTPQHFNTPVINILSEGEELLRLVKETLLRR